MNFLSEFLKITIASSFMNQRSGRFSRISLILNYVFTCIQEERNDITNIICI